MKYKINIRKGKSKMVLPLKIVTIIIRNCLFDWIKRGNIIKAMKIFIKINIGFKTIRGYKNWNLGKRLSFKFFEHYLDIELRNIENDELCQCEYEYDNNI